MSETKTRVSNKRPSYYQRNENNTTQSSVKSSGESQKVVSVKKENMSGEPLDPHSFSTVEIVCKYLYDTYGADGKIIILLNKDYSNKMFSSVFAKNQNYRKMKSIFVTQKSERIMKQEGLKILYHFSKIPRWGTELISFGITVPNFKDIRVLSCSKIEYKFHIEASEGPMNTGESAFSLPTIRGNIMSELIEANQLELIGDEYDYDHEDDTLVVCDWNDYKDQRIKAEEVFPGSGVVKWNNLEKITRNYKKVVAICKNREYSQYTSGGRLRFCAGMLITYLTNFPAQEVHIYCPLEGRLYFFPPHVHRDIEIAGFRDSLLEKSYSHRLDITRINLNDHTRAMALYSDRQNTGKIIKWVKTRGEKGLNDEQLNKLFSF